MVKKGIHYGLGMEDYHAWKLDKAKLKQGPISCSMLKSFADNPYAWLRAPEFKPTAAMQTGSLYDLALTDPDKLESSVAVSPFDNYKTKVAREWRDEQDGKLIVTQEDIDRALDAAEAVRNHAVAGPIMDGANCQVGVVGDVDGIPAKCLIDVLPSEDSEYCETLFDYKTTSKGLTDREVRRAIGDYRYHWQAAFYRTLFNKVSRDRLCDDFGFIFQDTSTHEIRVVMLSADALMMGSRSIKIALDEFKRCAEKGIGSRYAKTCDVVDLLPYHASSEEEEMESKP